MDAYTSLIALSALVLFHSAWREKATHNTRDARLLGFCGAVMAASACVLGLAG